MEGSVRKKSEARKSARKAKDERMAAEALAQKEEMKRLKNVKKQEMVDRLARIQRVAGVGAQELATELDLEEEFDPDAHDRAMQEAFGEEYYGAEDGEFEGEEVEEVGGGEEKEWEWGGDGGGNKAGFLAVREKVIGGRGAGDGEEGVGEEQEELVGEKADLARQLEEYYKLDYEDVIGEERKGVQADVET